MANLLVFVLDCIEECPNVLDAWEKAGVTGATILESTGMARVRNVIRDDMPLIPSLRDLLSSREEHHRTLFCVIEDDEILERAVAATEQVAGDLTRENTGILFVMPVTRVIGLKKRGPGQR